MRLDATAGPAGGRRCGAGGCACRRCGRRIRFRPRRADYGAGSCRQGQIKIALGARPLPTVTVSRARSRSRQIHSDLFNFLWSCAHVVRFVPDRPVSGNLFVEAGGGRVLGCLTGRNEGGFCAAFLASAVNSPGLINAACHARVKSIPAALVTGSTSAGSVRLFVPGDLAGDLLGHVGDDPGVIKADRAGSRRLRGDGQLGQRCPGRIMAPGDFAGDLDPELAWRRKPTATVAAPPCRAGARSRPPGPPARIGLRREDPGRTDRGDVE